MKAIKILSEMAKVISEIYESSDDFCGWTAANSNFEIIDNGMAYCIDYSIKGFRLVNAQLTVMKPKVVEGKKMWFEHKIDKTLSDVIEQTVCILIILRYDEIQEIELEEAEAKEKALEDEIAMNETYATLYITER